MLVVCHTPLRSAIQLRPQTLSYCFYSHCSLADLSGMLESKETNVLANMARLSHYDWKPDYLLKVAAIVGT